ncbi:hypothetical protein QVD17_39405 [Tagetes erecta]|uniref:Uncharacterized protein n=1 Tax=Tagetes erecta TaxID=13708 RepID=A0AAD8NH35_TARER|nr:hypothetical protein QVD17_39405 [Tagetes erecta]
MEKKWKAGQFPFAIRRIKDSEFKFIKTREAYILQDVKGKQEHRFPREVVEGDDEDDDEMMEEGEEIGNEEDGDGVNGEEDELVYKENKWNRETLKYEEETRRYEEAKKWRQDPDEITRCNIYQQEKYYNNIIDFVEQVREREHYIAGLPIEENYTRKDYSSTYPYVVGTPVPPYPLLQQSDWWPKPSRLSNAEEGSSNGIQPNNPFETSSLAKGLYESLFGDHSGSR